MFSDFFELYKTKSRKFSNDNGGQSVVVDYRGPASLADSFVIDLLAGPGAAYPDWPVSINAPRANTATIKDLGDLDSNGDAINVVVQVSYGTGKGTAKENEDGVIYKLKTAPFSEFITLDPSLFRWGAEDGEPLKNEEAAGKLTKGLRWNLTYYNIGDPPVDLITLMGSVNADTFRTPNGISVDPETVLFGEPNIDQTYRVSGAVETNATLSLTYIPQGWNRYYRTESNKYERLFVPGLGQYDNYELVDFPNFKTQSA